MRGMQALSTRLAALVSDRLQATGRTQQELSSALGLTPAAVNHRITGRNRFQLDELEILARFFDLPVSALIDPATYADWARHE